MGSPANPPGIPPRHLNTYYGTYAIGQEIRNLNNSSPESAVSGILTGILSRQFPPGAGYVIRPEDQINTRYADLNVYHHTAAHGYMHFLLVQCKRPTYENQEWMWRRGRNQLRDYLRGIQGGGQA
ncbi:hypothetical protein VTN96DRAFT_920 [Rasamsonia emersonii]|uniref:Uncharacterized protein n=1 Tax=Rasamsonia emersonii (strain ATCC 16479 / CBS 393.64 / IMI 116815) TaxID=1408163 RepID=A0A0F4YQ55_RASE3|nr:hypothetical protein T310_5592 [Rasamsonia emersonii CBS 393.64]KKA20384.1 hypothetical protein T310_5592 [Rasamsonia emersonii CBS 393.64]